MTTTTTTPAAASTASAPARTTAAGRLAALGRAELTLLLRSRAALFTAMLVPGITVISGRSMVKGLDLGGTGLSVATVLVPGALAMALFFAVYTNLVGVYVVRREGLVLKRLRTGEVRDWEILAGGALPAVLLALLQCALLAVGVAAVLDAPAPEAPHLIAAGLLIGLALLVAAAAVTAGFTRTAESAQLTFLPFLLLTMVGSGVFAPREVLPDALADVAALLPFSPVMDLLRGGWTGALDGSEQVRAVVVALVWTGLAVFAVQRWFRWEPRS
ncbi:ABC transporter permease [Streptomyces boninensis]|uniref:ABC transporter permease n=1 Tax=Streptomyces boninensis TaxID=2039455 RepID=UPI003B221F17